MDNILKIILEMAIFSSVMIVVVLAIRAIWGNKISINIISYLWIIVLVRLLMPITITSPVHIDSLFAHPIQEQSVIQTSNTDMAEIATLSKAQNINVNNTHVIAQKPTINNITNTTPEKTLYENLLDAVKSVSIYTYLFCIWVIGVSIVLLSNIKNIVVFSNKVNRSMAINNSYLNSILGKVKKKIGANQSVKLLRCKYMDMPVTFGLLKPKILLPMGFENAIDSKKVELILTHELLHIKRKDILKNYLWLCAKVIHWFNPLVWIAYNEYKDDVELAVDNKIISENDRNTALLYSQSILDMLSISNSTYKVPLALSFCKDKEKIKKRITDMVKPTRKLKSMSVLTVVLALVMVVGCFTTACQPTLSEDNSENVAQINYLDKKQETRFETEDDTKEENLVIEKRPIKENPFIQEKITSESHAVELAKQYSLYGSNDFKYEKSNGTHEKKTHLITSDNGIVQYSINNSDGTLDYIRVVQEINTNIENEPDIDDEPFMLESIRQFNRLDKKEQILDLVYSYFPDYYCMIEFAEPHNNGTINISGRMVNDIGQFRFLQIKYDENQEISLISFRYGEVEEHHMLIGTMTEDEMYDIARDYKTTDNEEIYWFSSNSGFSGIDHTVFADDFKTVIQIDESDRLPWIIRYNYDTVSQNEVSMEQAKENATSKLEEYFPQYSNFELEVISEDNIYFFEGDVYEDDQIIQKVFAYVTTDGQIDSFGRYPDSDLRAQHTADESKEIAIEYITKDLEELSLVNLKLIGTTENEEKGTYTHKFEYIADNPSEYDYSFTATVELFSTHGSIEKFEMIPNVDEINALSKDEIVQKAKEYISSEYPEADFSKLELEFVENMYLSPLQHQVQFYYDDIGYGAVITAVSGTNMGVFKNSEY